MKCNHDFLNFVRKGRARFHCRICDSDISIEVILIAEAEMDAAILNAIEDQFKETTDTQ